MKELRCRKCNRLLAKFDAPNKTIQPNGIENANAVVTDGKFSHLEIKCPRCKKENTF